MCCLKQAKTACSADTNYTYDKRGNRTAETGKKASRSYQYDETNRMTEGTNWKGDKSAYTYNGLGLRVNNTHTTHAGKVYARDYVIDYTSFENDDLMVFAEGNGQLEYEQKHVYAGSERIEQFTDKGNWERTLYVHEDVMGNTRYYTKANGQSFAELTYDAWGMPESPNKLLNNDHGNYVFATFTGYIYDTTLDIYFAEARFYDANNRTWLAMDPVKDGGNWYQYCYSNPTTFVDWLGLAGKSMFEQYTCSYGEPFILYADDINVKIAEIMGKVAVTNNLKERIVLTEILRDLYKTKKNMEYIAFGVSDNLRQFIKLYETGKGPDGKQLPEGEPALTPYYAGGDDQGTLTIGWGHHMKGDDYFEFDTAEGRVTVNLFDKKTCITRDQAEQLLEYDIMIREKTFNEEIGKINKKIYANIEEGQSFTRYIAFNQNQYDAFFDLLYSTGERIFHDHDLPAYLEKADFSDPEALKLQFGDYSNKYSEGHMKRRADELEIILYGEYERNNEDYMRHGDIWAKLSGT